MLETSFIPQDVADWKRYEASFKKPHRFKLLQEVLSIFGGDMRDRFLTWPDIYIDRLIKARRRAQKFNRLFQR